MALPGLGVAFGAGAGTIAYWMIGDVLLVAYGAGLGIVVGGIAALLSSR